jgi:Uma2 family endonuclease
MAIELSRRHFTVDDYYRMAEAGILREDDRVELIEGEIIEMLPIGSLHASVVDRLSAFFLTQVPRDQAQVRSQNPVRLNDRSEPLPDVCLLQPKADYYASGHPGPEDVLLLIEVSDSTIAYDRGVKLPLYARSGIPEVWIVDLSAEAIEIYREPSDGAYRSASVARRGEQVSPAALPEVKLAVDSILG